MKSVNLKQYKPQTPEQIFDEYKHFVGTLDIDSNLITAKRLMSWASDSAREFICIFCGSPPAEHNGFMWCRRCKQYKGIMPDCPIV